MTNAGKLLIVGIFGLALVLAGSAWWHQFQKGHRALALWGAEAAFLIRHAARVELLVLDETLPGVETPSAGSPLASETLAVDEKEIPIRRQLEISSAPGVLHARQALIEDASFRWDDAAVYGTAPWQYALRFLDGEKSATLLFDPKRGVVRLVRSPTEGQLSPAIAQGLAEVFREQVEAAH